MSIKTIVNLWLGEDKEINQKEIKSLIELANQGFIDIATVGNEFMYRCDLTEEKLIEHICYVKKFVKNMPIAYIDVYCEFSEIPAVAEVSL
tara:strand:+ start:809 stop:1081 length:273 start_codon:yes stop_codon:yes gene_type:complete